GKIYNYYIYMREYLDKKKYALIKMTMKG
ncbi:MAG: hypothetical protein AVDCRST_MAG96-1477, partial [uncultured Segetibacter sp.]